MKRIEIEVASCSGCPNLVNPRYLYPMCSQTQQKVDIMTIPSWCPLPDVEGKSNNLSRCDVCGNKFEARESGFCPYCNTGYISK